MWWRAGNLKDLLEEGKAIQAKFSQKKSQKKFQSDKEEKKYKRFVKLMEKGKVAKAMRCFGSQHSSILDVTDQVLNDLISKNPEAQGIQHDSLYQGPLKQKPVEEVIFECLDAEAIHKAAKKVDGAAGPSCADSEFWQCLICSEQFKHNTCYTMC